MTILKKQSELEPNDAYIRDSLGWYFYKKGDFKRAFKEVKKAWHGEKTDVVITKHLAIIYQNLIISLKRKNTSSRHSKIVKNMRKSWIL